MENISIIIPIAPGKGTPKVLESIKNIDYPKNKIEVLLTIGKNPSKQRNEAVKIAKGRYIFFFDDDVIFKPNHIKKALMNYTNDEIVLVGGPDKYNPEDKFLRRCFGIVMESYFATQKTSARFCPVGEKRFGTEKDLIMCNMSVRKSIFDLEKLDEDLYPCEETDLVNRIIERGYKTIYNPNLITMRSRRQNIRKFIKQFFVYGKARIKYAFVAMKKGYKTKNSLFLVPLVFVLYLGSLIFYHPAWYLIPALTYILTAILSSLLIVFQKKELKTILITPFLFLLIHFSYGIGMLYGSLRIIFPEETKNQEIIIKRIKC